jgi:hypothetical protein
MWPATQLAYSRISKPIYSKAVLYVILKPVINGKCVTSSGIQNSEHILTTCYTGCGIKCCNILIFINNESLCFVQNNMDLSYLIG